MSQAQTTEVFNCTPEQFFKIITDYEKYPEFLTEVKECRILQEEGNKKLVEYKINLIRSFTYRLWMTEEPFTKVSWVFDSGDLFKVSTGSWVLEEDAGKTRATYTLEAKFKMFVPGPVAKTLVNVNLPNMMSAYHKRVEELYG
ncbi:MAG: polyketide cyclase [Bdellovibrio sp.]|nr:MAG: polyketide cyclase [Bdellovibrio sp.]